MTFMDIAQTRRTKLKLFAMAIVLALATLAPVAVMAGGLFN